MQYGFVVMLCFGLVFVAVGLVQMLRAIVENRAGQEVRATLVSTRHTGAGQIIFCHATLCYEVEGKRYSTEIVTSTVILPDVGKSITVGVDPKNPNKVYLRRGKGYLVFFVIGGVILAFTFILVRL